VTISKQNTPASGTGMNPTPQSVLDAGKAARKRRSKD
jgi:hypothetical protein